MNAAAAPRHARYVELRPIASGGLACVSLAVRREGGFGRLCAVKRLHPHLREDEKLQRLFLQEAQIAGRLSHPNVISVYDVGQDDSGPYIVMNYVAGPTVPKLLRRVTEAGESMPLSVVLSIGEQIARGLHAAHELCSAEGKPLELIHRDISPQNVLIGYDGTVVLSDFGIAKVLAESSGTVSNALHGKLGYMAPEQLRFEAPTQASDIYALGVVLFELCTGRRLFDSDLASALRRHEQEPADLGEVRADAPEAFTELMFELLAPRPELRPQSAEEVAQRLREIRLDRLEEERNEEDLQALIERHFPGAREADEADTRERMQGAAAAATTPPPKATAEAPTRVVAGRVPVLRRSRARMVTLGLLLLVGALGGAVWIGNARSASLRSESAVVAPLPFEAPEPAPPETTSTAAETSPQAVKTAEPAPQSRPVSTTRRTHFPLWQ